jgi:nitrous oxide reductase accessory protein NosL
VAERQRLKVEAQSKAETAKVPLKIQVDSESHMANMNIYEAPAWAH